MPEILEGHGITKLSLWQFDVDGWSPRLVHEISFPPQGVPLHPQGASTEWASFANIRDAVQEDERRQAAMAQEHYHENLARALATLRADNVLPADHEAPETDIVGLLRRISHASAEPQYMLILTDLADTRYKAFPKLVPPAGDVRVVVLLVPAQPKDARLTLGKALSGPEQFEVRARQLQQAAPWIVVAPYFAHNLTELLADSRTR